MKITLLIAALLCAAALNAEEIKLTPEQEKNWQIKIEKPQNSKTLPLGEVMVQVVTPPALLHTISLPFEANVKKLYVAKYQTISRGQLLAEVTGTEWIEAQKRAISDAIEYRHHAHVAERKTILCKEEIIPQKECVAANAELEADTIKIAASKALLKSYGAGSEMIKELFGALKISPTIPLRSSVEGSIVELHASPGKSTSPSDALFVIQQKGSLWLESEIEAARAVSLKENQEVHISIDGHEIDTVILQLSPVVNPINQTRQVRFLLPLDERILSGLRRTALITLHFPSLKIPKNAVINADNRQIVFVKTDDGYQSVPVDVLGEDNRYYFVRKSPKLQKGIAVTSLAILKNMMGGEDE